jgi:hypothetical protein
MGVQAGEAPMLRFSPHPHCVHSILSQLQHPSPRKARGSALAYLERREALRILSYGTNVLLAYDQSRIHVQWKSYLYLLKVS